MKFSSFLLTATCLSTSTVNAFTRTSLRLPSSIMTRLFSDVTNAPYQVLVGNLPFDVAKESFESIVLEHDNSHKMIRLIMNRETGLSRGFAFIDYDTKEAADAASIALSGIEINGRQAKVESIGQKSATPPVKRDRREGSRDNFRESFAKPSNQNSVFIGSLDFAINEEELTSMIASVVGEGKINTIRIGKDRETGRSKGYAHVDCISPEAAEEIVSGLDGYMANGRAIKTDHAESGRKSSSSSSFSSERPERPRRESRSGASVYIANLAWDITPELVEDMVNDVVGPGVFLKVRLATDRETGKMKGFGHIDVVDMAAAERAVRELDGMEVLGRQIRADFASNDKKPPSSGGRSGGGGGRRFENNNSREEDGAFGSWA